MMALPKDERGASVATTRAEEGAGRASPEKVAEAGSVDEYIGARLRQAFDVVAQEPVPDRFLQLMAALDKG